MLFYILLYSPIWLLVLAIFISALVSDKGEFGENVVFFSLLALLLSLLPALIALDYWSGYADNLGAVEEQKKVIAVYERQRNNLIKTLENFNYPKPALVNADTPVAAISENLRQVEKELALARQELAKAQVEIAATKHGPMSGVVSFVGGPEHGLD